ncbi:hypothetical protein NLI96_g9726 [Meripilus lineatus]|uniref:Tc1-like transposase DDE domain-containing protein n=1 Tax=Meripilus lineatus TaxID=2056292 RepID=A0AAD5UX65_9APHY|nr:hypothetical protein NLI96_g9726 [Physisporinus lineatus]
MKKISAAQSTLILSLLHSGLSEAKIQKKTRHSLSTISRVRSKHCPDLPRQKGGRPSKLSPSQVVYATQLFHRGKAENAVQAAKIISNMNSQTISATTLRRKLKGFGLQFAERYKEWTMEDWKRVIWSDETKINRLGSDGKRYVWKQAEESLSDRLVEGTVKFGGGNLMLWGCMGWEGIGYACRIEGKIDGELYELILGDELMNSLEYWDKDIGDIVFQQDNDPKHICKRAKKWFKDQGMEVLSWPAQSPDLNPIEHLWYYLKQRLREYEEPAGGVKELWRRTEVEWEKIPKEVCQKLIESMPRRIAAVIRAKGGYTKY